ncbi:MAG: hypothetical protein ACKOFX_00265 [Solirubrobacterales bacterium]
MVGLTEESLRGGGADRLGALRTSAAEPRRTVRTEVVVGGVLVVAALLGFLFLRGGGAPGVTGATPNAPISTLEVEPPTTALLDEEALVSVALEEGDFPPDLARGDSVIVTVRPDLDTDGDPRTLGGLSTVVSVAAPVDGGSTWIVVLRAAKTLPEILIGARDVSLAIVAGGGR